MKRLLYGLGLIVAVFLLYHNPETHAGDFNDVNVLQPADTTVTGDFSNTGFDSSNIFYSIVDTLSDTSIWFMNISGRVRLGAGQRLYIGISIDDTTEVPDIDTLYLRAGSWISGPIYQWFSFSAELTDFEAQSNVIDTLHIFLTTGSSSGSVIVEDLRIESRIVGVNGT